MQYSSREIDKYFKPANMHSLNKREDLEIYTQMTNDAQRDLNKKNENMSKCGSGFELLKGIQSQWNLEMLFNIA